MRDFNPPPTPWTEVEWEYMRKWAGAHLWLLSQGESRYYAWFKAQELVGRIPRQGAISGGIGRSLAQVGQIYPYRGGQGEEEEGAVGGELVEEEPEEKGSGEEENKEEKKRPYRKRRRNRS